MSYFPAAVKTYTIPFNYQTPPYQVLAQYGAAYSCVRIYTSADFASSGTPIVINYLATDGTWHEDYSSTILAGLSWGPSMAVEGIITPLQQTFSIPYPVFPRIFQIQCNTTITAGSVQLYLQNL